MSMHTEIRLLITGVVAIIITSANAANYYVAPDGRDSDNGSIDRPFATLLKAHERVTAGDTVFIRGGTYQGRSMTLSKSGRSATQRICYWAYPGEQPVFDYASTAGIMVTGSWVHVKGLEFNKGYIFVDNAHDDILELINAHHVNGTGIAILHGTGGHLILNCDSHDNFDAISKDSPGENADGFGVHYQRSGAKDTIRGCRAWWNSDDGYDFINHEVPITIENSWAMGHGYIYYGTDRAGNGNGFKIGSSKTGIRHIVRNCVAWKNRSSGFYANHSSGGNTWYNNTSFQNGTQYNMLASTWSEPNGRGTRTDGVTLTGDKRHIMRNNIAYPEKNSYIDGYGVDAEFNSWDLGITPSSDDFRTITDPSLTVTGQALDDISPMFGPRKEDGSLPDVDFLQLASGSAMIDKGTDVKLSFTGEAPDLGADEFEPVTTIIKTLNNRFNPTAVTAVPEMFTVIPENHTGVGPVEKGGRTRSGRGIYTLSGRRTPALSTSLPPAGIYILK